MTKGGYFSSEAWAVFN